MKCLCQVYVEDPHAVPDGDCMAFGESLWASGRNLAAEALQPVNTATTVRMRNDKVSLSDGPFAETKEQLAGFYLIEAREARAGSIEVRPVRQLAPAAT